MDIKQTIANIFNNVKPQQVPANPNTQAQPGTGNPAGMDQQVGTVVSPGTAANGTIPANTGAAANNAAAPPKEKAPLADFADLWQPVKTDPNAPAPVNQFKVDPAKVLEAARKRDFTQYIKPESLKAIAAGGEEGAKAFLETINDLGQRMHADNAMVATSIAEQTYNKAMKDFDAALPERLKSLNAGDTIRSENPLFKNPAVKPIIDGLVSQLRVKFPQAEISELKDHANNFLSDFAKSLTPAPKEVSTGKSKGKTDWSDYLGGDA